jgi:hypothetical protein
MTHEHSSPTPPTDKHPAWLARALPSIPAGTRVWSIVETLPPLSLTAEQRSHALTTGDVTVGIDVPFRWKRALSREPGHPKRQRKPSHKTALEHAKKAGATSVTIDGVTYRFGESTDTDTDRELADFEARHGKA